MTPRSGMLYTVALAACRVEVNYPEVHPAAGSKLSVHIPNQQVTEAEADEVTQLLEANGHPVVLIATERGFDRLVQLV